MRVVALNCCSRRDRGGTGLVLEPFLRGLHDGGCEVELYEISRLNITPTEGTLDWVFGVSAQGRDEEAKALLDRLQTADLWVFATNVLSNGASAHMANLMDRIHSFLEPSLPEKGQMRLRQGVLEGKVVLVAGSVMWDVAEMDLLVKQTKRFSKRLQREFAGALLRPHALALPHMMWLGKETEHILAAAKKAGAEFAEKGELSEETINAVGSKLMSERVYSRHLNKLAKEGQQSPQPETDDDRVVVDTKPVQFEFGSDIDSRTKRSIVDTLESMGRVGRRAENDYQEKVASLKGRADEVVPAITTALQAIPQARHLDRWSLVHLLGELGHSASLETLDELIAAPLPEETSKNVCAGSVCGEEVIVKTSAIDAVKKTVANGSRDGLKVLLKHANSGVFSVKRAAVQAYLDVGGRGARSKLSKVLADEDQHILDIRRRDVREVPQAVVLDRTGDIQTIQDNVPIRLEEPGHGGVQRREGETVVTGDRPQIGK